MRFDLISDEEYENLPADDEECFVKFESIVRSNMHRILNNEEHGQFAKTLKESYMSAVSSVGQANGIPNTDLPKYDFADYASVQTAYGIFSLRIQGQVARIRTQSRRGNNSNSVLLLPKTKLAIHHHIAQIREVVLKADITEGR